MNNESKIIDKIIADAKTKADEIIADANSVAQTKINEAQQKAQKQKEDSMLVADIEADKAKAKEISAAEMKAKKKILATKQSLIEETIQAAKQKLLSYGEDENKEIILSMLKQAGANETTEVILSTKASQALKVAVGSAGYRLSTESRDILGGFILKDGDIEYNYSFESMIIVEKEQLEQIAAEKLFN